MLITFTIITGVLFILLSLAFIFELDWLGITSIILLIIMAIICWLMVGLMATENTKCKLVPKENYEILIGEDKIVVTNHYNEMLEIFYDAKTYNILTHKDKYYFIEYHNYNMYGGHIGKGFEIKDERFLKK